MFIMNVTNESQRTKALGNFFEFKPGQVKQMSDDLGMFISLKRAEQGLVALPQEYEDMEWRESDIGKEAIARAKQAGLDAYLGALRKLIYNNQVSLRQDLEKSNIKADPAVFASEGELNAMRLVAKYQKGKDDEAQKRADEVRKLVGDIGGVSK